MSARILDGAAVAAQIRSELSSRAAAFERNAGRQPGLAIVLVGDKPDSQIYVNSKLKSAGDEGITATLSHLPASTSLDEILSLVRRLNADAATDGILVQAPLPDSLGAAAMQSVFDAIDPSKDVDGVTPVNVGRLVQNRADLVACTPAGIVELLRRSGIEVAGKHAVVIGRSDIVGKPVSMLLLHRHATVTVCHSRTQDLPKVAATADILVAALGRPGFVRRSFVRPGATVIDVGINLVTDPDVAHEIFHEGHPRRGLFDRKGSVLVGDVHPEVAEVAGALDSRARRRGSADHCDAHGEHRRRGRTPLRLGAMTKVALTGGIATGKSYVLERLKARGIPVIDADDLVHEALGAGTPATNAIASRFGSGLLKPDGSMNRKLLGVEVFRDAEVRRQIESILHPIVYDAIRKWFGSLDRAVRGRVDPVAVRNGA